MSAGQIRRPRRWPWMLLCALLAVATAGSWIVASQARTERQRAARSEPPAPSVVTAKVEAGELVDEIVFDGVLERENTLVVKGPAIPETRSVVTALPMGVGDVVETGAVLVEVSGRPVLALPGNFPAYRDLTLGDSGRDVRQLQAALRRLYGTPVTGTFDNRTATDVKRMYQRNGYRASTTPAGPAPKPTTETDPEAEPDPEPPAVIAPAAELAYFRTLPATIVEVSRRVGDDAADQAILALSSGGWQVTAQIDAATEARVDRAGDAARWHLGDGPFRGRKAVLRGVADLPQPPDSEPVGESTAIRQVIVRISGGAVADFQVGESQQVAVTLSRSPAGTVIVPVSALWTGADGRASVTVAEPDGQRSVPVEVVLTVDGRAAVAPASDLAAGTDVVIAYRDETSDGW